MSRWNEPATKTDYVVAIAAMFVAIFFGALVIIMATN